jgi:3-phenylpropionate/cinnamic acid dioxygenase small subunit
MSDYEAICQALFEEAELLDTGRFEEWLDQFTEDAVYQVPVRTTRERAAADCEVSSEMFHLNESLHSLKVRVARLRTEFAWAEDPPSRTRHVVSNVRVRPAEQPDEVEARSYLLVYRNRGADAGHDLLSGEREDLLRRVDGRWRIARRRVVLDQSTLGTKNLAIFL